MRFHHAIPTFSGSLRSGRWVRTLLVLMAASGSSFARADLPCQIHVGQPVVDFGRVPPAAGTLALQQAPVPIGKRRFLLTVVCQSNQTMTLSYLAAAASTDRFRFTESGEYTLRVSDATLDGSKVNLGLVRVPGEAPAPITDSLRIPFNASVVPVRNGLAAQGKSWSLWVEAEAWLTAADLHVREEKTWTADGVVDAPELAPSQTLTLTAQGIPGSCTPTLSSSNLSYGHINPQSLNATTPTALPTKTVTLSVSCSAAAAIAIRAIDNRQSMKSGTAASDSTAFGLGWTANQESIGSVHVRYSDLSTDSVPASLLYSSDSSVTGGATWTTAPAAGMDLDTRLILSAGDGATASPRAATLHRGTLSVTPEIAPANSMTLSQEVNLDGSITIELVY